FSEMFWPRLIVYTDLRDRGRLLKPIGENAYLVKHKDNTLKLLLVMEEKMPVGIKDVMEQVEKAKKNNLSLIMAIVSLQGDLTYYEVSDVELSK
ncbi:MAG: endonuclease, partial [Desulfurococcaceae archaeon]